MLPPTLENIPNVATAQTRNKPQVKETAKPTPTNKKRKEADTPQVTPPAQKQKVADETSLKLENAQKELEELKRQLAEKAEAEAKLKAEKEEQAERRRQLEEEFSKLKEEYATLEANKKKKTSVPPDVTAMNQLFLAVAGENDFLERWFKTNYATAPSYDIKLRRHNWRKAKLTELCNTFPEYKDDALKYIKARLESKEKQNEKKRKEAKKKTQRGSTDSEAKPATASGEEEEEAQGNDEKSESEEEDDNKMKQ